MPQIWRLIAHHEMANEAVDWSIRSGRIAVGWGDIGDLRELKPEAAHDIFLAIRGAYRDLQNAHTGGPSLWNFSSKMNAGDLVILNGTKRLAVMEVTGPYVYTALADSFGTGHYQHQRRAVLTDEDPDALWAAVGAKVAEGDNLRWTVALCSGDAAAAGTDPQHERYLEGARYELVQRRPDEINWSPRSDARACACST